MDPVLEVVMKVGPYGLFVLMFYLWRQERQERVDTQRSFQQLSIDGIKAMNEMTNAIRSLRFTLFSSEKRREAVFDE
jgi:hypothetical protein